MISIHRDQVPRGRPSERRVPIFVALVLVTALVSAVALRLRGLGFPITYGPDQEPTVARALLHLQGDLNPHVFNYPSLHPYILTGAFWTYAKLTGAAIPTQVSSIFEVNLLASDPMIPLLQPFYILGRGVTVALAAGTVVLVYLIGERLYGRVVGAIGALFLALAPLHVWDSHYASVDVPTAFWIVLAAYATVRGMHSCGVGWYVLAGISSGLAAGTKYPGAVALAFPLVGLVLRDLNEHRPEIASRSSRKPRAGLIAILGIVTAFVSLLGRVFHADLVAWTSRFTISGVLPPPARSMLVAGCWGLACVGVVLMLIAVFLARGQSRLAYLLGRIWPQPTAILVVAVAAITFLAVVPYAILDGRAFLNGLYAEVVHAGAGHYGMDVTAQGLYRRGLYFLVAGLPFGLGLPLYLAALAGILLAFVRYNQGDWLLVCFVVLYNVVAGLGKVVFLRYMIPMVPFLCLLAARALWFRSTAASLPTRVSRIALLLCVVGYTAAFAHTTARRYEHDTRIAAADALPDLFPRDTTVALTRFPNYYPGIDEDWFEIIRCPEGTYDALRLVECDADVIVLSGMLYWRPYRNPLRFAPQYDHYEALRQGELGYKLVARFQESYLNKGFYTLLDPMYDGYFVSPTIEVYEREPALCKGETCDVRSLREYSDLARAHMARETVAVYEHVLAGRG